MLTRIHMHMSFLGVFFAGPAHTIRPPPGKAAKRFPEK
jgi:hypothetical protein